MKFSRNPSTGALEVYTDEGIYAGVVATMNIDTDMAMDGGPGSGNFGHKGRPGKVGGSGPGGGKQYRGGRSDIGYFGSRKDWLNGLQGEAQHKAVRFIAEQKRNKEDALRRREKIEGMQTQGLLTSEEVQTMLKNNNLDNVTKETPIEEFIMTRNGNAGDRMELMDYVQQARNWRENKDRLIAENLTPDEQKVYKYLETNLPEGGPEIHRNLKLKALAIPVREKEIPDEILYAAGVKERPVVRKDMPYQWYIDLRQNAKVTTNMENEMGETIGNPRYAHTYTPEEFVQLNKDFLNAVKYDRLSPTKYRQAVLAIKSMRVLMSATKQGEGYWERDYNGIKPTPEMIARLDADEKFKLVDLMNRMNSGFNPVDKFNKVEDIEASDFTNFETELRGLNLRTSGEQQLVRDYVTIMDKMLTGETAIENNTVKERKEAEKQKSEEDHKAFIAKRDEEQKKFLADGGADHKKNVMKFFHETLSDETINLLDYGELDRAMRFSGIMRDGSHFISSPLVPVEVYRGAALAYKRALERCPFMAGEFGGFGDRYASSSIAGCKKNAYSMSGTEIVINFGLFKDVSEIKERRRKSEELKWHVKTDPDLPVGYTDTAHEIGHAVANWLHRYCFGAFIGKQKSGGSFYSERIYDNEVANILKERTLKALGMKNDYDLIKEELSEYGASSRLNKKAGQAKNNTKSDEFFAECFAELMSSSQPRRMAAEFGRQLDKFIKENGITEFSSATTPSTMPNLVRG